PSPRCSSGTSPRYPTATPCSSTPHAATRSAACCVRRTSPRASSTCCCPNAPGRPPGATSSSTAVSRRASTTATPSPEEVLIMRAKTVLGPVELDPDLAVLPHEHVLIDYRQKEGQAPPAGTSFEDEAVEVLGRLKETGVQAI